MKISVLLSAATLLSSSVLIAPHSSQNFSMLNCNKVTIDEGPQISRIQLCRANDKFANLKFFHNSGFGTSTLKVNQLKPTIFQMSPNKRQVFLQLEESQLNFEELRASGTEWKLTLLRQNSEPNKADSAPESFSCLLSESSNCAKDVDE